MAIFSANILLYIILLYFNLFVNKIFCIGSFFVYYDEELGHLVYNLSIDKEKSVILFNLLLFFVKKSDIMVYMIFCLKQLRSGIICQ